SCRGVIWKSPRIPLLPAMCVGSPYALTFAGLSGCSNGVLLLPPTSNSRICSPPSDSCARLRRLRRERRPPCGSSGGHPGQDRFQPGRPADPFGELLPLSRLRREGAEGGSAAGYA